LKNRESAGGHERRSCRPGGGVVVSAAHGHVVTETAADQVTAILRAAGFAGHVRGGSRRRDPEPAGGFQVLTQAGAVFAVWIPASGQDPRNLDDFGVSYRMALKYVEAASRAGLDAELWGTIWYYARITASSASGPAGGMAIGREREQRW
jgi:hypothetical protein